MDARVRDASRPPILLPNAHWYGTLAAVRELGRRGVEVRIAASARLRQSAWSRYAARTITSPDEHEQLGAYLQWLIAQGRETPGMALCATSDDTRFLYTRHERELRPYYRFANVGLPVLRELLDKTRLHAQADKAGLLTPFTLFPENADDAERLAAKSRYPLLIKQRTQVFSKTLDKGRPVSRPEDVRAAYEAFCARNRFEPELLEAWPDADRAMLQEYLPESSGRIYCLAGFIAPGGRSWATRAAMKVLSHPRHLGIGLFFEHAPVVPQVEEALLALCRNAGYAGIFQCEFLEHEGRHLLIDFNPRFYNYMAFDHARGLPQAYFSYLLAIGAHDELAAELARAKETPPGAERMVYAYRFGAFAQLSMERLFGRVGRDEVAHWRRWREGASRVVDPVWSPGDLRPGLADAASYLWRAVRHPRDFVRRHTRKPF